MCRKETWSSQRMYSSKENKSFTRTKVMFDRGNGMKNYKLFTNGEKSE